MAKKTGTGTVVRARDPSGRILVRGQAPRGADGHYVSWAAFKPRDAEGRVVALARVPAWVREKIQEARAAERARAAEQAARAAEAAKARRRAREQERRRAEKAAELAAERAKAERRARRAAAEAERARAEASKKKAAERARAEAAARAAEAAAAAEAARAERRARDKKRREAKKRAEAAALAAEEARKARRRERDRARREEKKRAEAEAEKRREAARLAREEAERLEREKALGKAEEKAAEAPKKEQKKSDEVKARAEEVSRTLEEERKRFGKEIVTASEVLDAILIEARNEALRLGLLDRFRTDPTLVRNPNTGSLGQQIGYSSLLDREAVEDLKAIIHDKAMEIADLLNDPRSRIYVSVALTEFGRNLIGSPTKVVMETAQGVLSQSWQGIKGGKPERVAARIAKYLIALINQQPRNAALIEGIVIRGYIARE